METTRENARKKEGISREDEEGGGRRIRKRKRGRLALKERTIKEGNNGRRWRLEEVRKKKKVKEENGREREGNRIRGSR